MREVCLKLPDPSLRKLQMLARAEDVSIGQIVRDAIESELHRRETPTPPEPHASAACPAQPPREDAEKLAREINEPTPQPAPEPEVAQAKIAPLAPAPEEHSLIAEVQSVVETQQAQAATHPAPNVPAIASETAPTPSGEPTLRDDIAAATGWHDLSRRLRIRNCFITEQNGILVIKQVTDQTIMCSLEDLGYAYEDLRDRFRAPIPGPSPAPSRERVFSTIRATSIENQPIEARN